jgi:hypothetical protein
MVVSRYAKEGKEGKKKGMMEMGGVAIILELLDVYPDLPEAAPLMAFWEEGEMKCWSAAQALRGFREALKRCVEGVEANDFTLHSGRVGAATWLALQGASAAVIKAAGRWKSEAYLVYLRVVEEAHSMASDLLERE